eukprot:gene17617-23193_t
MIDISNGLLRVNQRPIMIRGVNIHEHDPVSGHTVSNQVIEADIKLLKRNNFNAIRTSHYPQQTWLYELCTIYGIYVIDECNIETHGMKPYIGYLSDHKLWKHAYLSRLQRMYARDKVNTCIIGWSLGNESGYGSHHDDMADWIRSTDNTRIVMYEPASYGSREDITMNGIRNKTASDILCPMYARVDDCITLANMFPDKPLIQCEYAHMMGNSGGNLNRYWESFRQFSRLQGGFIWDWVDQGIATVDNNSKLKYSYGGDFGEIKHDDSNKLPSNVWSVVVIGRLANHTVWAGKGYPLGFSQINITKLFSNGIDSLLLNMDDVNDDAHISIHNKVDTKIDGKSNNTSIQWIESNYVTNSNVEGVNTQTFDPDILLQAEIPASLTASSKTIQIVISGSTGMIESLRINHVDILMNNETLASMEGTLTPSRVHFHRADTDNDRCGYRPVWRALGLDKSFDYVHNKDYNKLDKILIDEDVIGLNQLTYVTVQRLDEPLEEDKLAQGVMCTWTMTPQFTNMSEARIIRLLNTFKEDLFAQVTYVYARNSHEENYIHQLAGLFRFGRESIHNSYQSIYLNNSLGINVKLWKVTLYMCSTIKQAEALSKGPIGVSKESEDKSEEVFEPIDRVIRHVKWSISYWLLSNGELKMSVKADTSSLIAVIPRIGLQFLFNPNLSKVTWRGAGPHESYPDRTASAVDAIHIAPASNLYTPYIVPSENGSRCNIKWLKLQSDVFDSKYLPSQSKTLANVDSFVSTNSVNVSDNHLDIYFNPLDKSSVTTTSDSEISNDVIVASTGNVTIYKDILQKIYNKLIILQS